MQSSKTSRKSYLSAQYINGPYFLSNFQSPRSIIHELVWYPFGHTNELGKPPTDPRSGTSSVLSERMEGAKVGFEFSRKRIKKTVMIKIMNKNFNFMRQLSYKIKRIRASFRMMRSNFSFRPYRTAQSSTMSS